jgi:hypothetical protein
MKYRFKGRGQQIGRETLVREITRARERRTAKERYIYIYIVLYIYDPTVVSCLDSKSSKSESIHYRNCE